MYYSVDNYNIMNDFDIEKIVNSGEIFFLNKLEDDKFKSMYEFIHTDQYLIITFDKIKKNYKYSKDKKHLKKSTKTILKQALIIVNI